MRRLVGGSAGLHVPHCWKSHVTTHLLLLSFHGCLSFSSFCDLSGFAVTALKGGGGWLLFPFYLVLVCVSVLVTLCLMYSSICGICRYVMIVYLFLTLWL